MVFHLFGKQGRKVAALEEAMLRVVIMMSNGGLC